MWMKRWTSPRASAWRTRTVVCWSWIQWFIPTSTKSQPWAKGDVWKTNYSCSLAFPSIIVHWIHWIIGITSFCCTVALEAAWPLWLSGPLSAWSAAYLSRTQGMPVTRDLGANSVPCHINWIFDLAFYISMASYAWIPLLPDSFFLK